MISIYNTCFYFGILEYSDVRIIIADDQKFIPNSLFMNYKMEKRKFTSKISFSFSRS